MKLTKKGLFWNGHFEFCRYHYCITRYYTMELWNIILNNDGSWLRQEFKCTFDYTVIPGQHRVKHCLKSNNNNKLPTALILTNCRNKLEKVTTQEWCLTLVAPQRSSVTWQDFVYKSETDVVNIINPSTQKAEAVRSLSLRSA